MLLQPPFLMIGTAQCGHLRMCSRAAIASKSRCACRAEPSRSRRCSAVSGARTASASPPSPSPQLSRSQTRSTSKMSTGRRQIGHHAARPALRCVSMCFARHGEQKLCEQRRSLIGASPCSSSPMALRQMPHTSGAGLSGSHSTHLGVSLLAATIDALALRGAMPTPSSSAWLTTKLTARCHALSTASVAVRMSLRPLVSMSKLSPSMRTVVSWQMGSEPRRLLVSSVSCHDSVSAVRTRYRERQVLKGLHADTARFVSQPALSTSSAGTAHGAHRVLIGTKMPRLGRGTLRKSSCVPDASSWALSDLHSVVTSTHERAPEVHISAALRSESE